VPGTEIFTDLVLLFKGPDIQGYEPEIIYVVGDVFAKVKKIYYQRKNRDFAFILFLYFCNLNL
jgi:hypothetical protein